MFGTGIATTTVTNFFSTGFGQVIEFFLFAMLLLLPFILVVWLIRLGWGIVTRLIR